MKENLIADLGLRMADSRGGGLRELREGARIWREEIWTEGSEGNEDESNYGAMVVVFPFSGCENLTSIKGRKDLRKSLIFGKVQLQPVDFRKFSAFLSPPGREKKVNAQKGGGW